MMHSRYRGMAPGDWDLQRNLTPRELYHAGDYLLRMVTPRRLRKDGQVEIPTIPIGAIQETYDYALPLIAKILMDRKVDPEDATAIVKIFVMEGEPTTR
jgi:hypothetical protein